MTSKPVVHLMKPDKPISKMTDEERQAFVAFVGFCENLQSGETWVALFGGDKDPGGRQQFRYVRPDKVKGVSKRRKVNG